MVPERGDAILEATLDLVAEVGYASLTIDAVAARARTSKSTVYRRWADKHDLVLAAMSSGNAVEPLDLKDTGSLRGDLIEYARTLAATIDGFEGRLMLGMSQAVRDDTNLRERMEERSRRIAPRLDERMLDRARERGELGLSSQPEILGEVAASLLVYRVVSSLPLDDLFVEHLVDNIIFPALVHASGPPARAGHDRHAPIDAGATGVEHELGNSAHQSRQDDAKDASGALPS